MLLVHQWSTSGVVGNKGEVGTEGGGFGRAPRTLPLHQPELVSETPEIRGGTRVLRPEPGTQEEEEENEEEEEDNGMEEEGKVVEMEKEEEEEGGAPRVRSYRLLHGSLPTAPPPPRPTCSTVRIIIIIIFVICVIDVNC